VAGGCCAGPIAWPPSRRYNTAFRGQSQRGGPRCLQVRRALPGPQAARPPLVQELSAAMSRLLIVFLAFFVLLIGGGGLFLANWDIPAPKAKVEKTLPNDRLGK